MGLRKVYEAALSYRDNSVLPYTGTMWHGELIVPPKHYKETAASSGSSPGMLWSSQAPRSVLGAPVIGNGPGGVTRYCNRPISFASITSQIEWPSWNIKRWVVDGDSGTEFQQLCGGVASWSELNTSFNVNNFYGAQTSMNISQLYGRFVLEPPSSFWRIGNPWDAHAAVQLDAETMVLTGKYLDGASVNGGVGTGIGDIAVDSVAKRVWVRKSFNNAGEIEAWYYDFNNPSTAQYLHSIWAPNATNGIVLSSDGYLFVMDVQDWIILYDYDGNLHSSFRQPRPYPCPGGVAWTWDDLYRRLLRVTGTPDAVDGACTMKVEGYYPIPTADSLTPPIPRQVPRKGRRIYVVSRLVGTGAEPVGSVPATLKLNGVAVASGRTDDKGDALLQVVIPAPGTTQVEVDVDVDTSEQVARSIPGVSDAPDLDFEFGG